MGRAKNLVQEISGKTSISQIILDFRKAIKGKFNKRTSKTNFTAKGAVFEFDYEDGVRYRVTVESLEKKK